jgi:hypothetical protein
LSAPASLQPFGLVEGRRNSARERVIGVMSRPPHPDAFLFGRERELRVIEERLDSVSDKGGALLIRGEAGVGKTAILEAAKLLAG